MITKNNLQEQSRMRDINFDEFLNQEFQLQEQDVNQIKSQISTSIRNIINNHQNNRSQSPLRNVEQSNTKKSLQPKLSEQQLKEIENYQALSYQQYPVQPCVKSLYYISKIAQLQQVNVLVPPTVLVQMNGDNRFIYNCPLDGHLIVDNSKVTESSLKKFMKKHINTILDLYPIESKMLLPRYVIRISQNESRKNETKVYYSEDALIADALVLWENCDMAIQLFIKQKGIRPKIFRYIMKNGNTIKSFSICNQKNLLNDSIIVIETQQFLDNLFSLRLRESFSVTSSGFAKSFTNNNSNKLKQNEISKDKSVLPSQMLPKTLEEFKLPVYYNDMQVIIPHKKIMRAFCCTTDNLKNLTMTQFRPSALASAEKMTQDLLRLFNQYYLKSNKFGNITKFVCDFIEGENGQIYLLHIKSFECEGVIQDWQQKWNPSSTINNDPWLIKKKDLIDDFETQYKQCQANIICSNKSFCDIFVKSCKNEDMWKFNLKKLNVLPFIPAKTRKRYQQDYEASQFEWTDNKLRGSVCPLIPLIFFKEKIKEISISPKRRQTIAFSKKQSSHYIQFLPTEVEERLRMRQSIVMDSKPILNLNNVTQITQIEKPQLREELPCCFPCFKVIELYSQRNEAMIFKSDLASEELKDLKMCLVENWDDKKIKFVLNQYKNSKLYQIKVPQSRTPIQLSEQASQNITQKVKLDQIPNTKQILIDSIDAEQKPKFIKKQLRYKPQSEDPRDLPNLLTPFQKSQLDAYQQQALMTQRENIKQLSSSASLMNLQQKLIRKSRSNRNIQKENVVQKAKEQMRTMEFIERDQTINHQKKYSQATNNQKLKESVNKKELVKVIDQFGLKLDHASKTMIDKDVSRNPMTLRPAQNPYTKSQLKSFINQTQQEHTHQTDQILFNLNQKQQSIIQQSGKTMGVRKVSQKHLFDQKIQEFSMYFINKRDIQNSKVKLSYRNLDQLKTSRTHESNNYSNKAGLQQQQFNKDN
ncbi:UNKNOWN [Stylonychia lemnae]|uniref:Uncharacterized protein n=1 Tax=Stylonychia lemnae TaxID=5949 RepID=A0A078A2L7_STYLE|nr:UNKNOWN [Stylonychia lemnae]|eukprot:CDW75778.1 UNKNOWN [Stylonychia lemnae]